MSLSPWFEWGVPIGALLFAGGSYLWVRYEVAKFERRYGKRG